MLDFKKISRSVMRRSKGISDPRIMHATRDWWLGIIIGLTIAVSGGGYLWYLNQSYQKTTFITDSVAVNGATYRAEVVAKAVGIVEKKREQFNQQIGTLPVGEILITEPQSEVSDEEAVTVMDESSTTTATVPPLASEDNNGDEPASQDDEITTTPNEISDTAIPSVVEPAATLELGF